MNKFMCLKHGKVGYDKCRECRKEEQTNNWEVDFVEKGADLEHTRW